MYINNYVENEDSTLQTVYLVTFLLTVYSMQNLDSTRVLCQKAVAAYFSSEHIPIFSIVDKQ